ncbi:MULTISPECIES: DNA/RNA nuclease SfsA [Desulfosediminicola]|uniref:DNA/RNA nuclease SfsA n=1 Tax=Desulfosediminicola TaxID=2886823 RepID=UPI0010AC8774|nr:DNA/RNA nuclease SfsA [Desulfosediminicola ganghwensis]
MQFNPPLTTATLIRRYKRFLVDVELTDGSTLTIHCPNTGSMRSCSEPGSPVAMSISDNPKRKYPHTLEMVQNNGTWIGVNTGLTNRLVAEAINDGQIAEFDKVTAIRREVKVSSSSRLDLAVSHNEMTTYVEIKNCSLVENGQAMFPDAVTTRGTKHLKELMILSEQGHGACIFFLVQRMDTDSFAPAAHIDPVYSETLKEAVDKGVMILAYQAEVSPHGIDVIRKLPCEI